MSWWTKGKTKLEIEDEMYRISQVVMTQGDVDCLIDLIPYAEKKKFIDGWHEQDEEYDG